jgi:hypothetical protein
MNEARVYIAACGVCCSVCGLHLKGFCLPCGSGLKKDEENVKKMEEQIKNLGHVCSIFQCIVEKGIGYCMRDFPEFPCKLYEEHFFPYSESFL